MEYFDPEFCDFDDEGLPHVKWLNCASCGSKHQPIEQTLLVNDDGTPEGLIACGHCGCGKGLMTVMGSPEFMAHMMTEGSFEGADVSLTLKPNPLSSAINKGSN